MYIYPNQNLHVMATTMTMMKSRCSQRLHLKLLAFRNLITLKHSRHGYRVRRLFRMAMAVLTMVCAIMVVIRWTWGASFVSTVSIGDVGRSNHDESENANNRSNFLSLSTSNVPTPHITAFNSSGATASGISVLELNDAKSSLTEAKRHKLSPLRPIDKSKYSVRINTWRRNEQLLASVQHLSTCSGIAQIIIIWCDTEYKPPAEEIMKIQQANFIDINIEYHSINSLNERFNVLIQPLTKGILSIDDDVLRPCDALDDGFYRWTDYPDRMVGYDYRMHIVNKSQPTTTTNDILSSSWSYGFLSDTKKYNRYSMVLPRFSFIHVDYLHLYMTYIPKRIMDTIDKTFNCEDIAMSFFVSSLTYGQVPLLANQWSISTMVKLSSQKAISDSTNHRQLRDKCVDDFGYLLGLKDGFASIITATGTKNHYDIQEETTIDEWGVLYNHEIWHDNRRNIPFGIGDKIQQHPLYVKEDFTLRRKEFVKKLMEWGRGNGSHMESFQKLRTKIDKLGMLLQ